ncbi:MAG: outer membrane beta-barrel protein [Acidobacteria bacterium]|nr:outer membrane beta-barrel protein [Acidobacteriota bacterium]MCA1651693.1 outer membrane beta-barrel protein [Acidobacteriota bacterium]
MRQLLILSATVVVCSIPAAARAQGANTSVQGFGGFTFGTSSVVGGTSMASTFGGSVAAGLTPNIQIVGEVGRLSDIKPPLLGLLDLTPVDLRVSAWYGEAGVRFIASPHSVVRPYAEATAGMARLSTSLSGFGRRTDAVLDAGLAFLNRTEPLLGAGGGVVVQGGPLALDIGYRYKKILATGVASALNARNAYQVNEVRIGVGVRF